MVDVWISNSNDYDYDCTGLELVLIGWVGGLVNVSN